MGTPQKHLKTLRATLRACFIRVTDQASESFPRRMPESSIAKAEPIERTR
jgi:hypothetical protein